MGVGVSLASRRHFVISNQAMDGKPASRLLNYLDPTLDVTWSDLVSSRALGPRSSVLACRTVPGIFVVAPAGQCAAVAQLHYLCPESAL
jgi:hypothetical protein